MFCKSTLRRSLFRRRGWSSSAQERQLLPRAMRNISIISHIDAGKTSLSGAWLHHTKTIAASDDQMLLDNLSAERERGITIKAHICSMVHQHTLVNLIDTPGHVDFAYEVERALSACDGAVLLIDATQGVQAQTLANLALARKNALTIVPAINKIDSPIADVDNTLEQLLDLELDPTAAHLISARESHGVVELLDDVIARVPPPSLRSADDVLRALLIDSFYDRFMGVVCLIRVFDGAVRVGDSIEFSSNGKQFVVQELGVMRVNHQRVALDELHTGMVGYVVCGLRDPRDAMVGDTMTSKAAATEPPVVPLKGFQPPNPMLFAGVFCEHTEQYDRLRDAIARLRLNDASVQVMPASSNALGAGFRVGCLGGLHFEVFCDRLLDEYDLRVVATRPSVPFKVLPHKDGAEATLYDAPSDFPSSDQLPFVSVLEPRCRATVVCPTEMQGPVLTLMSEARGKPLEAMPLGTTGASIRLVYDLPLSAVMVSELPSRLKSATKGYASLDYEATDYVKADLVKLDIVINQEPVDAFACVVERSEARDIGLQMVQHLKKLLPRELFVIPLQAKIGNKVIARETIKALRKNVASRTQGGGDVSRKKKLLEKQKKGKAKRRKLGGVSIDHNVFLKILSKR